MNEVEYREIPGFTGYRAGSDGSIWSCMKGQGSHWHNDMRAEPIGEWKQLKPSPRKEDGRTRYTLRNDAGVYVRKYGSTFVLLAFSGPCPPGMECCHGDGNCLNDSSSNLRWDTPTANKADMVEHGTRLKGETATCVVLTEPEIIEIRNMRAAGKTLQQIADVFGVTAANICSICKRKTWRHVV